MDYDIVIVGGGIAGLSAALTAARAGKRTIIFTGGVPGGELLNIELVDGIPGQEFGIAGFDLCPIAQEQATNAPETVATADPDAGNQAEKAALPACQYQQTRDWHASIENGRISRYRVNLLVTFILGDSDDED